MENLEIKSIFFKDDMLYLIDQRKLPLKEEYFACNNYKSVYKAIKDMIVRGAPAIGIAAAYGMVLAAKEFLYENKGNFLSNLINAGNYLRKSRPTAVNLSWAIDNLLNIAAKHKDKTPEEIYYLLYDKAREMEREDLLTNKKMAEFQDEIIPQKATILTHCNTGALATVGWGTALGVIRTAFYSGKDIFVYADETRPRLQGARLTAWELMKENIPSKLIADSVAATLIRDGKIDLILVGADRIASNGDTANKIGTFMLSVVAKTYNVPFYVVAPSSTFDLSIKSGEDIIIEERSPDEVLKIGNTQIAPKDFPVYNPAFDVTPHENITAIICEKAVIRKPFSENIAKLSEEK